VVGKGLNCKFDFDIDNGRINFTCKKNCQHQSTKIFPISKSFYFYSIFFFFLNFIYFFILFIYIYRVSPKKKTSP
jgi:hypothetical protein